MFVNVTLLIITCDKIFYKIIYHSNFQLSHLYEWMFILRQAVVEIASYLSSTPTSCDDVLQFWSRNAALGIYPTLCQLAKVHLSASVASVPVESMFSTTGLIANSRRSSISAERLNRISFIHDNSKMAF